MGKTYQQDRVNGDQKSTAIKKQLSRKQRRRALTEAKKILDIISITGIDGMAEEELDEYFVEE